MTRDLEADLRTHLRALDSVTGSSPDHLSAAVSRSLARRTRQRRIAAGTAGLVLAGGLVGLLSLRGPNPETVSASPSAPSAQATNVAGLDSLETIPPSTDPPSTVPALSALPSTSNDPVPPPARSTWRAMSPDPRGLVYDSAAVWMNGQALLIDGQASNGGSFPAGVASYSVETDRWVTLERPATLGLATARVVVWTGSEALVIGGLTQAQEEVKADDHAYDPALNEWRLIAPRPGALSASSPYVWTGTALLAWPDEAASPFRYSTDTDTWEATSPPPIPWRNAATSVWTGTEWIVWGGRDATSDRDDGAAYNPTTNTWRVLAASPLSPRRTEGVWTGDEILIMAGSSGNVSSPFAHSNGAAYDPLADSWRPIADGFAHPGFRGVWAGTIAVMFAKGRGVTYDPALDRWDELCCNEAGAAAGTPLWTGEQILSFGSWNDPAIGGVVITPPPGYTEWMRIEALPQIEPGAPCPAVTSQSTPSSDLAAMLGEGPVRLVGWGPTFDIAPPANYGSEIWGGNKTVWAIDASVDGPVVLTGHQLDGPNDVRFGAGAEPSTRLVIDVSERTPLNGGWRDWPDALRLNGPGCYGIQIETENSWEFIVLEATPG